MSAGANKHHHTPASLNGKEKFSDLGATTGAIASRAA